MNYLVAFTTFGWDEFIDRQFERIKRRVASGHVCAVADETHGPIDGLPPGRTIRTSESEMMDQCGLSPLTELHPFGKKSAFWWNLDYLTYRAVKEFPDFDYYVTMDYDACINLDLDQLIRRISERELDFVAEPIPASDTWPWLEPHRGLYAGQELKGDLLCVTVMSRRAATHLWQRRQEMAAAYGLGEIPYWPFCEVFCAMETRAGGLRRGRLSDFGDTAHYSFRPAFSERAATSFGPGSFVHPVFDKPRLLRSLIAHQHPFSDLLRPGSRVRLQLKEFPASDYMPLIAKETWSRLLRTTRRTS